MRKVLIFDTSILCVWLQVRGKETCGSQNDIWDKNRIQKLIREEEKANSTFVLPMASIIETGNHISQASSNRYETAKRLTDIIIKAADATSPWAAFAEQSTLWQPDHLRDLAEYWPQLAAQGLSIGDATIKDVAEYYTKTSMEVQILTGDEGLKAYEPPQPTQPLLIPRRRGRS